MDPNDPNKKKWFPGLWNMSPSIFQIFQGWKTVLVWFNRIPWTCKMIRASSRATSWTKGLGTEQRLKLVSEANFWFDQISQISATCRTCRTCSFLTQFHNSLHVRHLLRLSDILSVSKFILSLSEFVISSLCGSGIDLSVSVCDVLRRARLAAFSTLSVVSTLMVPWRGRGGKCGNDNKMKSENIGHWEMEMASLILALKRFQMRHFDTFCTCS